MRKLVTAHTVQQVVDVRHRSVVVLVRSILRHEPVERIQDDQLELPGLELVEVIVQPIDVLQLASDVLDEQLVADFFHRDAAGLHDLGDAVGARFPMQLVVDDQDVATHGLEDVEPFASAGHCQSQIGHHP